MKKLILTLALLPMTGFAQPDNATGLWKPFEFLVGSWEGKGEGRWGTSTVTSEYEYVLDGSFLKGTVTADYPKQEKNPKGEVHVNWDILSFDKARKKYVLRQFHNEFIVNQYAVDSLSVGAKKFEFITESIENFGAGWRAKEAFEILSENEYIETFSLAPPGKDFRVAVTTRFKRKK